MFQEMERINTWHLLNESHKFCNCLWYNILCYGSETGKLLDNRKHATMTLHQLVDGLCQVETLKGKPKVVVVQVCTG